MKLQRGVLSLLTVLVLFVAIGAAVAWRLLPAEEGGAAATAPELPDIEGVQVVSAEQFMGSQPVEGVVVVRDVMWIRVIANGRAVPARESRVATRSSGVVQGVFVREDSRVRAGDLLVQLDTVQAAMSLARARNDLFRAEIQFEERMLLGGQIVSAAERDSRERILRAELLTTPQLAVTQAEMDMEFTRVRAPFAGRIADLRAVEGAFLGNGAEVLTLLSVEPTIRVEVNVLEHEIGYLAPGRRASLRFNALPNETFEGVVETVNPVVDPEASTGRVTLTLPNPGGRVLPGFYAWVSLDAQAFEDRVMIPRDAVVQRGDGNRDVVFVLKGADVSRWNEAGRPVEGRGMADWKYVAIGRRNDTHVEIVPSDDTSMLEPGDIVLVNGHHYLAHDTQVHLVENVVAAGGRPGR
jgi:HlyD family secretion protein